MISRFLKSNQPSVIILVILTGVLLWFYSFVDPIGISIPADGINMPFFNFLSSYIQYNSVLALAFTFILILLQGFLLVQFNRKYILINNRTYLPAFIYILISGSFVQEQRLNPALIGSVFLFIAIDFIYSTYRTDYALNKIYLAGFFISIASLFWAPLAVFVLIIWISLSILRAFVGREWIVGILGFLTPYLFVYVYYFVFMGNSSLNVLINHFIENFKLIKAFYSLQLAYYIFYGFLSLLIIAASYTMITNFQKKKIRTRKYFEINWWFFFISLSLFLFFKNVKYEIIYLISIPLSFLITDYFYSVKRSWYLNAIVLILIGSLVYLQIMAHL